MIDKPISTPISKTGASITLVTTITNSNSQCEPSEECRPLCDPCTSPDCGSECAPDCTCAPDCEEQGREYNPDQDQYPFEEDQNCEPNN